MTIAGLAPDDFTTEAGLIYQEETVVLSDGASEPLILPSVRQQIMSIFLREVGERKELKHLEFGVCPKPSDG
ncbi:MAG: hypothetical protein ACLQVJ_03415 [Syntrophobacteraceae bacterium]